MTIRIDGRIVACEVVKDRAATARKPAAGRERGAGRPPEAQVCPRCHVRAMVMVDGCPTCLACAESRCG